MTGADVQISRVLPDTPYATLDAYRADGGGEAIGVVPELSRQ